MKQLQYQNYEELTCDVVNTFDNLNDDFSDVSVIAKYNEANEIIRELLYIGYKIASVRLHREDFEGYCDEYIITLNSDGIWCEKFKYENGYLTDESDVIYIMDNCSSAVIPYCRSRDVYEVSVSDDAIYENDSDEALDEEHRYTVNGEPVDKESFDDYVSQFAPDLAYDKDDEYISENSDNNTDDAAAPTINVKLNVDIDEIRATFDKWKYYNNYYVKKNV